MENGEPAQSSFDVDLAEKIKVVGVYYQTTILILSMANRKRLFLTFNIG